ncbi:Circadian clock-controlled protein [Papilio xuthus]|nr:Circadian clock-controlled protein [Papilio xuthus]
MIKSANIGMRILGQGVPSLGIESIDPMKIDLLDIKLPNITLTYKNTTMTGYSKCEVQNVMLNMDSLKLKFDLKCPALELSGHYFVSGDLLSLHLEGQGLGKTSTGIYLIHVDFDLERITGEDGKTYLAIKKFKHTSEALEPIKFQYDNLFNGQKELSDAAHAFAHEHYKEVMAPFQDAVHDVHFKYLSKSINQLLKTTPIDNLFIH